MPCGTAAPGVAAPDESPGMNGARPGVVPISGSTSSTPDGSSSSRATGRLLSDAPEQPSPTGTRSRHTTAAATRRALPTWQECPNPTATDQPHTRGADMPVDWSDREVDR